MKKLPILVLILIDALLLGIGLCVFALFHHVIPEKGIYVPHEASLSDFTGDTFQFEIQTSNESLPTSFSDSGSGDQGTLEEPPLELSSSSENPLLPFETLSTDDSSQEATSISSPDPVPEESTSYPDSDISGNISTDTTVNLSSDSSSEVPSYPLVELKDLTLPGFIGFTDDVCETSTSYTSSNLCITLTQVRLAFSIEGKPCDTSVHIADIYVRSISKLRTAFANDTYGHGQRELPWKTAERVKAVVAINGDYYSTSATAGVVIRNGVFYRSEPNDDVCVLYADGTVKTFGKEDFPGELIMDQNVWQAWCFGPSLLTPEGEIKTHFPDCAVISLNPRSSFGYFEPGHYCIICVDGRTEGNSGMRLSHLSAVFHQLGCKVAYNLDGGQSSALIFNGKIVSTLYNGGRASSDIIYVAE